MRMRCRRRGAVSFGLLLLLTPLYPAAAQLHQTAGGMAGIPVDRSEG